MSDDLHPAGSSGSRLDDVDEVRDELLEAADAKLARANDQGEVRILYRYYLTDGTRDGNGSYVYTTHVRPTRPMHYDTALEQLVRLVELEKTCKECADNFRYGMGPSHNGSRSCRSGSLASGGNRAHCTCDTCF